MGGIGIAEQRADLDVGGEEFGDELSTDGAGGADDQDRWHFLRRLAVG
jgi:hypothetical protein